jgi:hypothetical protein
MQDRTPYPVQVAEDFYAFDTYVSRHRWLSFWHQINAVLRSRPGSVLEIGPGFGATTHALRQAGVAVTTFDFDVNLRPDIVGDVRALAQLVAPKSFDAVCAFQILEHLPFECFGPTLDALAGASRSKVLISLPHWGYPVELRFRLLKDRLAFAISRKLTRPKQWSFDGEHYWELGAKGYSVAAVSKEISRHLTIERQYFCPDYSYHYFFECSVF